ncbi:MAG: prepilin peptidase [Clostridiales bacterium]|nr:prepilin peptidase [Clostridiales bacterium]
MELDQYFTVAGVVCFGILGLLIGSFLNVCIYRIPEGRTVVRGHSMCMSCSHTLSAADLVPVFSWLFLRGKCRYCGAPVPSRYAKIEALTALTFATVAFFRKEWLFIPGDSLFEIPNMIKLILVATLFAVLIVQMMIQKDHGIGRPGVLLWVSGVLAVRFALLVFEPEIVTETLISSALAAATCIPALALAIWLSPEKLCSRLFWGSVFHFEAFREYFTPEQRALRISDGVHAAVCITLGFLPALPGIVVYSLIRIFVPWEKSVPYLGIVTAASALVGFLMTVFGVFGVF